MRPSKKCPVKANLRCKGKSYTRDEEFCFKDSCKLLKMLYSQNKQNVLSNNNYLYRCLH